MTRTLSRSSSTRRAFLQGNEAARSASLNFRSAFSETVCSHGKHNCWNDNHVSERLKVDFNSAFFDDPRGLLRKAKAAIALGEDMHALDIGRERLRERWHAAS